jgi:Kef-type K+ transport system membrane component KefB
VVSRLTDFRAICHDNEISLMNNFLEKIEHHFQTPFTNSVLVFSIILFIILFLPLIFSRLKIPGIIGLILSGVIIGPEGLFLIRKNSAVDLFSTIGLLYIMFIAGLELDLGLFRKNKNRSIIFGIFTFAFPILIGFPVCYYLLNYGFATSLLTSSMFATHTLIAYPIVNRLGISKTQAVAITVGGTILTDTAVLLLLAIISGSRVSGLSGAFFWEMAISLSVFLAVVAFVIPKVSSWFFRRLEDEKYAHFVYVLSVVFFCAFLAELSGLEPIIGAFAAGLTLNRLVPHTSSLMNRIEFVGNSIFIPFFLISVGMLIDVKVVFSGPSALIIAATLTTVALLGKWIAAQLTRFSFNYSAAEGNVIFGLSSAHAAATLAVILVGHNIGLIDDAILNGTVILILVTCVIASFVTEKAGRALLLETSSSPDQPVDAQHILVSIANPDTMERLIDFAVMMKHPRDPSPVFALSVVKDDQQAHTKLIEAKKLLGKAIIQGAAADRHVEIMATIDRNISNGIRRIATEKFISTIVLGWSGKKNLADIIFGKTFDPLVKHTTQTVYITRFVSPLNIQQRLVIFCPPFAEREIGFTRWLPEILNLAYNLRMSIELFVTAEVFIAIEMFANQKGIPLSIRHHGLLNYSRIHEVSGTLTTADMMVIVCAREGGVSHTPLLKTLPDKAAVLFKAQNLIFVYPSSVADTSLSSYEQESSAGLLDKGVEVFNLAKSLFTKK